MKLCLSFLMIGCLVVSTVGCGGADKSMEFDSAPPEQPSSTEDSNEDVYLDTSEDGSENEVAESPPEVGAPPPEDGVVMYAPDLEPPTADEPGFSLTEPEEARPAEAAPTAAPEFNPSPELEAEAASKGFVLQTVYYGTDRKPNISQAERWQDFYSLLWTAAIAGVITLLLMVGIRISSRRIILSLLTIAGLMVTFYFGRATLLEKQKIEQDDRNNNQVYGREINEVEGKIEIERGVCFVSIPKVHEQGSGEFERPKFYEFNVNREKHFDLPEVRLIDDRQKFLSLVRADVQNSTQKHILVFVHGYNVTFEMAAMRTGQLAHDLDFNGPVALFSWPSNGTTVGYASDEETVDLSAPQLKEFLTDIIKDTGAQSVHVIAHSMGNRALTEMLIDLERARNDDGLPVLNQVVMAAPDVNATKFRNNIVDKIKDAARNFTLYASSKDIALLGSEILRQSDYTRLGQGGDDRQVFPEIQTLQTIDASELPGQALFLLELGHSYYVNPSVMKDLKYLLETPSPVRQREWLKELPHRPAGSYWIFDANGSHVR